MFRFLGRYKSPSLGTGSQNQKSKLVEYVRNIFYKSVLKINDLSVFCRRITEKYFIFTTHFMEKRTVYQLIRSFSATEKREARKFLSSPYFNQRQDLLDIYELLEDDSAVPDLFSVWQKLFPETPFDDQKMRLLLSYLHRLLEQFLGIREFTANDLNAELQLAVAYRKRGMAEAFERTQKNLSARLSGQSPHDLQYYQYVHQLQWESFQLHYVQNPTEVSLLLDLSESADLAYLIQKLRIVCLLTAHQSVYKSDLPDIWTAEVVSMAERKESDNFPVLRVYLQCYRMLRYPEIEAHFNGFKQSLFEEAGHFSSEEMHSLYIWAINYCIRRLNEGQAIYYKEALDLYKTGLVRGYIFDNGVLSRFTYHNIVAAGLHTGELDWVRFFINEYKNRLEKKYRESSFSFNLARLEYASRHYEFVLELLQKANYRDPLLNLAAKTLLLKTYYETGELDLLQSHLDAMRNYIHRKEVIGYHKTNYLNIIRYTEKMMRLPANDRQLAASFWETVQQEKILTEKAFFGKMLGVGE